MPISFLIPLLALSQGTTAALWSGQFPFQSYLPSQLQTYTLFSSIPSVEHDAKVPIDPTDSLEAALSTCTTHTPIPQILSLSPLIIYLENFTTPLESTHLITLGAPNFTPSYISTPTGKRPLSGRTSTSAALPIEHELTQCILARARRFMGTMLDGDEPFSTPQLVRYEKGQKYDIHTDYWPRHQVIDEGKDRGRLFNRVASFFVFLHVSEGLEGGETYFPGAKLPASAMEKDGGSWLGGKVLKGGRQDVEEEREKGVRFVPVEGNAVFWVNIDEDGNGDERVRHAGLPVNGEGEKVGMNLWPRKWYGWEDGVERGEKKKGERKGKWV